MTAETKYVTAGDLRSRMHIDVTMANGDVYEIRKIGPAEMAEIGGNIDLTVFLTKDGKSVNKRKTYTVEQQRNILDYQARVCARGISSMKVGEKDGEGDIWIEDIPVSHRHQLFPKILVFSGASKEEAEKLAPLSEAQVS